MGLILLFLFLGPRLPLFFLLIVLALFRKINPYTAAGVFAVTKLSLLILMGTHIIAAIIFSTLGYGLALLYFMTLRNFDHTVLRWYMVAIFGGLFVSMFY